MKTFLIAISICLSFFVEAQNSSLRELLDSAKILFQSTKDMNQEEFDKFDYYRIVHKLEQVISVDPNNMEARYYLGYTYSRINSRDGRSMIDMNLDLLYKASEQFEMVNKTTPQYKGEIIILDPYSKITSEWGSMAMSYWHKLKPDSARWAFNEGKKRGGFSEFILALNRKVLDTCASKSIMMSSGDNSTIPLWYLQIAENYRKDVSVVDISLLNTIWYPNFLIKSQVVEFDMPEKVLDSVEYIDWADSTITIKDFSWTVKPSYYEHYILRGDRIFLSLMRENKFERQIYFSLGFMEESRLSLGNYIANEILADKLVINGSEKRNFEQYKSSMSEILKLSRFINVNSPDELILLDYFRFDLLQQMSDLIEKKDNAKAKELMSLIDTLAPESKFPFQDPSGKTSADVLRQKL